MRVKLISYKFRQQILAIKKSPYPLIIILLCVLLSILNYTPGTWQTGWDTLHPEFNWGINIPRHLFGMWQDNQGMGNVGGHSHAADTPRILVMFIADLFLPKNFLRYFWLFLTLIAGPLGVYYFVKDIVLVDLKNRKKAALVSFIGALYYLFNLGTVQQYIVPLEMYTTLYGFLPWVFLYSSKVLLYGRKYLLNLVIAVFLATPLAYAITVFFGFYLSLFVFLFITLIVLKAWKNKKYIKNFIIVNLAVLGMSLYWLIPSLYFSINHGDFVSESHINSIFSDDIFKHNVIHGNFWDLFLLRGYLVSWRNYDFGTDKHYYLMTDWNTYLSSKPLLVIQTALIALIIIGIIYSLLRKAKTKTTAGVVGIFLISAFMIMTINPPLGWLFDIIRKNLGLFEEALRNPYTKFSVELMFAFSVFVSFSGLLFLDVIERFRILKTIAYKLTTIIFTVFFCIYMFPAFDGKLISKDVRLKIPGEYFEMFKWLNDQKDERRIATLPIYTFWGWQYMDWGYQGAGFMWFGTKQPMLERDFDRWNPYNEQYYNEMSEAIYSQDVSKLDNIINKYGIGYVLLSKNTIAPGYGHEVLAMEDTETFLKDSSLFSDIKTFGDLNIYKVASENNDDFLKLNEESKMVYDYPFQGLVRTKKSAGITIQKEGNEYKIDKKINNLNTNGVEVIFPDYKYIDNAVPMILRGKYDNVNNILSLRYHLQIPLIKVDDVKITSEKLPYIDENYDVEILSGNDTYLIINKDLSYKLNSLDSDYKELGVGYLYTRQNNLVEFYSGIYSDILLTSDVGFNADCSDGKDVRISTSINTLSLWSFTNTACFQKVLSVPIGNYLFATKYKYKSMYGDFPKYCILINGECFSDLSFKTKSIRDTLLSTVDYVAMDNVDVFGIRAYSPKGKEELSNIDYYDFHTEVIKQSHKYVLPNIKIKNAFEDYYKDKTKDLTENNFHISAYIPAIDYYALDKQDLFELSSYESTNKKKFIKSYEEGLKLVTEGRSGSIYESIDLFNFDSSLDYIIEVNLNKTVGIPVTIGLLDNHYEHYGVYERMNDLNNVFILQGTKNQDNSGSTLAFINENVGQSTSENIVSYVKLNPFMGNYLSGIKVAKNTDNSLNIFTTEDVDASKIFPFLYSIPKNENNTLIMKQSYEKGWVCLSGRNLHIQAEGNSNAFICDGGYIIFVPIIIQILGYVTIIPLLFYSILSVKAPD